MTSVGTTRTESEAPRRNHIEHWDGTAWSIYPAPQVLDGQTRLTGVSCVGGTQSCVAVDQSGNAVTSTDGGSTWSTPASLSASTLAGVSCPTASFCVSVSRAGEIWNSTNPFDASPTWSSVTLDAAAHDWVRRGIERGDGYVYGLDVAAMMLYAAQRRDVALYEPLAGAAHAGG